MSEIKQVIIMRKDLKMNKGKCIAQGSHASLGAILASGSTSYVPIADTFCIHITDHNVMSWLENEFTKVVLAVNSEDELLEMRKKITDAGIVSVLITDAGHTVFNGVATNTCIGIAPTKSTVIDQITGHLKLF